MNTNLFPWCPPRGPSSNTLVPAGTTTPSRTPSCAQNKNSISVLDIPSNTCGPLLVSDSKRVHILFTSVLNYISSNKTPCPDRNSVLDLIPWLVTPVFPRIGGRVVPIKHRMYYVHRQHVLQNNENQCTVVHTGWVYRDIRFWVPPLTHTQWVWVIPTGMTRYAYYRVLSSSPRQRSKAAAAFSPHTLRRLIGPSAAPAAGRGGGPACIRRRTPAALRGRIVCARPCCSRCSLPARLARPPARTGRLPAPLAPSATARPTRRACPTPPAPAAPGAVRQRLYASASYGAGTGRTHPPSSAPDAARVQVPRHPAGQTGALQGSGVQCCTGKTVSSTITAMLVQILAVKLALPSGLPLLRGRSA